jgi:hypothetical protein
MSMRRSSTLLSGFLLITTSMAAVGTATAAPLPPLPYGISALINVGPLTSFDISFVDNRGIYYFADRSSASIQIINGATFGVLGQATGFAGISPGGNALSGPDGVVVVQTGANYTLYGGDAGSTLRSFNVTGCTVACNPNSAANLGGTVNTGGAPFRLDEMAANGAGLIFAANNANSPAFASLIATASPPGPAGTGPLAPALLTGATPPAGTWTQPILIPGQVASGGMEQSVWNPNTGTWFVSVPSFNGTDAGGVQEFSLTGSPGRTYNFNSMGLAGGCSASGLALGGNGNLMVGCNSGGTARAIVLNPTGTGSIVTTLPTQNTDQLWYDPTSNRFYVTGTNAKGDRVIDIYDGNTYALLQEIDLTALGFGNGNIHSVAVNPLNGEIFVPIPGNGGAVSGNTQCPSGCVVAFDLIPEPPSFTIFLAGLLLAGLGMHLQLRRRSADAS